MFGTLIVQLPSVYCGGKLAVYHQQKEEQFSFGSNIDTSGNYYYTAFYADCLHEIKPITEGYRLCLIYNLVYTGPSGVCPSPADNESQINAIVSSINDWESDIDSPPRLMAYILEHKYSQVSTSFDSLKRIDRGVADVLIEACQRKRFDLFLATIDAHREWCGHMTPDDLLEETITIESLVLLDNSKIKYSCELDKEFVVPEEFLDCEPDNEDFEGYTGNEGCSLDQQYHFTALLLWPQKQRPLVLNVDCMIKLFIQNSQNEIDFRCASDIIQSLKSGNKTVSIENSLEYLKLLENSDRFDCAAEEIIKAQCRLSIIGSTVPLLSFFLNMKRFDLLHLAISKITDCLQVQDSSLPLVDASVTFLNFLCTVDQLKEFALSFIDIITQLLCLLKPRSSVQKYLNSSSFTQVLSTAGSKYGWDAIKPFLIKLSTTLSANNVVAFGQFLFNLVSGLQAEEDALAICQELAEVYGLAIVQEETGHLKPSFWDPVARDSKFIVNIIQSFVMLKCHTTLPLIIDAFVKKPTCYPVLDTLVPALKDLSHLIDNFSSVLPLQRLVAYCISVLTKSLDKVQPASDWSQTTSLNCSCSDCCTIMSFLKNPSSKQSRFKMGRSRRQHIHQRLDMSGCDVTHVTEHFGNPHTLVVTKSREKKEKQRSKEQSALSFLSELVITNTNGQSDDSPASKRQKCVIDLTV